MSHLADLALRGGVAFLPGAGLQQCDILITDGRISSIAAAGAGDAGENVDVTGLTILPGAVDAHIHLGHGMDIARPRAPEDAKSETAAAAIGGVTTFISYVMSADPYLPVFDELCQIAEAGARVDFGFHFVIATEDHLAELPELIRRGAPSAKLFMNIRGNEGARLGLPGTDDGFMFRMLEVLAAHNGLLCPHPENIEVAWVLRDRVTAADPDGKDGLATWNATRPPFVEADALSRATYFARITNTPVHAVHTSSGEALDAALRQREAGSDVCIETCLHYLTHDTNSPVAEIGKVNPPLRAPEDREALWRGISRGDINTVATDHIHRPVSCKDGGIWKAQPGFPGLDAFLPALLTYGHHQRGLPLDRLIPLVSENPAKRMGLANKGTLRPGADADITILDLNASWVVGKDNLGTDADYSIYEGETMKASVIHTLSRGRFALRDGALQEDAVGSGKYITRALG
jgi:dihydroorotase-like cyclic amidohydrolase